MCNEEICNELYKQYRRLNAVVNKVTSQYRHSMKVTNNALYDLSEAQIDIEEEVKSIMNKLRGGSSNG